MKISTNLASAEIRMSYQGAHQLSWSYLLDLICADAYHSRIGILHFNVGDLKLQGPIERRAEVSGESGNPNSIAIVQLVTSEPIQNESEADLIYTVEYGLLAAKSLRKHNPLAPRERRLLKQYSVFTWKSRFLGIPIRLAGMFNHPQLFDRFMRQMHNQFISNRFLPAYYHLKVWDNKSVL